MGGAAWPWEVLVEDPFVGREALMRALLVGGVCVRLEVISGDRLLCLISGNRFICSSFIALPPALACAPRLPPCTYASESADSEGDHSVLGSGLHSPPPACARRSRRARSCFRRPTGSTSRTAPKTSYARSERRRTWLTRKGCGGIAERACYARRLSDTEKTRQ